MKLKSIYIDGLHNAVNKTYQLNNLVYFYGRNGAGKTTILNAIQLALLGYIPGTAKNSREAILKHSRDGHITVRLELDDNGSPVTIERKVDSKATKVTTMPSDYPITDIVADIELPIFNFNDFINQTANKLKDYFIKNLLPTTEGNLNWQDILKSGLAMVSVENPDEVLAFGMNLISEVSGSPLEQVVQANKIFKDEQAFNKSELSRLQATVDSLIYYKDYTGPTDIKTITTTLIVLEALRDSVIRYESARQVVENNMNELAQLEAKYESMGGDEQRKQIQESLDAIRLQYDDILHKSKDIETQFNTVKAKKASLSAIIQQGGICPYTKDTCKGLNLDDIRATIESCDIQMESENKQWHEYDEQLADMKKQINHYECVLSEFSGISVKIDSLKRSVASLPDKPNTDKTIIDINREIQEYDDAKGKLQANQAYESTIDNITKTKYKIELENDALSAWVKLTDINGLQTTLTSKPFEELAVTMTKYIQDMYGDDSLKVKFDVSTKANSFSFGLIRQDKYIAYEQLSSGEKCLYTLALMICIIHHSSSSLKLLLCDDMFDHLDAPAVEGTFTALKNIPDIQFILAGVKECENAKDVMVQI